MPPACHHQYQILESSKEAFAAESTNMVRILELQVLDFNSDTTPTKALSSNLFSYLLGRKYRVVFVSNVSKIIKRWSKEESFTIFENHVFRNIFLSTENA